MRWAYLIIASLCEVCWFYCIGYLNHFSWDQVKDLTLFQGSEYGYFLLALLGYAGFGVLNMVFFSKAIQKIAPSISFAVWTGLALVGISMVDWIVLDIEISLIQWLCIGSILTGVIGIKMTTSSKSTLVG